MSLGIWRDCWEDVDACGSLQFGLHHLWCYQLEYNICKLDCCLVLVFLFLTDYYFSGGMRYRNLALAKTSHGETVIGKLKPVAYAGKW